MASNAPVSIRFDRPMDRVSVEARFHLSPRADGRVRWLSDRAMEYDHPSLTPLTMYRAILEGGYRAVDGSVDGLRHSWTFTTEGPPVLSATTPGAGDTGVDPSTYVALDFSRPMNVGSLASAVSLSPAIGFQLLQDPADSRRVIVAPQALLDTNAPYSLTVTAAALDVNGNHLQAGTTIEFHTGRLQRLQHWIGFVAQPLTGGGTSAVWIVNEARLPRQVLGGSAAAFNWSSAGDRMLVRSDAGEWSDAALDGASKQLPFTAVWAAYLAPGRGYAYLDSGRLRLLQPDGQMREVEVGVAAAAVSPDGTTIAFATIAGPGATIFAYNVDLRSLSRLQVEPGAVDGLAWAPDGQSLAYRVAAERSGQGVIRARFLRGSTQVVTVATGAVGPPAWQADSRHVFFTASVDTPAGPVPKAFRLAAGDQPPSRLTAAAGLPAGGTVAVDQLDPSPDGHEVAFISSSSGTAQVWVMNADGSGLTQLTRYGENGFAYQSAEAAWTPT